MFARKCQIEGCKPFTATHTIKVRLKSGLIGVLLVCEMHRRTNDADLQVKS